jgi:hypothetical protein
MKPAAVPLLVVALLLLSAQPGVETVTTVSVGSHEVPTGADAVIVAGGNVTLPGDERVNTSLYVIGGTVQVNGTLEGRLVQLSGEVRLSAASRVTDTYRMLGGESDVADGADVSLDVVAEPVTTERSPAETAGLLFVQAALLALVAFGIGRRFPNLLANVAHSVRHHPAVSGTVGLLAVVTLLALFVFMAFTIVLLPVSVLGFVASGVVVLYAYAAVGFLIGEYLPTARTDLATAGGAVIFFLAGRVLNLVPVVGGVVSLLVLLVGIGAVVVTYFGLREFHPPELEPVRR